MGLQPSWYVWRKDAAPLSGTEEQTARAKSAEYAHERVFALFANGEYELD
jgi:hypothetical protein